MSQFLETLKARFVDAQARLQTAQQKLQQAQAEHNAAMQEFASWQNAVTVEAKRENPDAQPFPAQPQPVAVMHRVQQYQAIPVVPGVAPQSQSQPAAHEQVNKTHLIREVLRQNPNGTKPADLWRRLKDNNVSRAYVYAVLNRLKERKQVSERRGKYFLLVGARSEETAKENAQLQ
jgi:hypothetical protein